MGQFCAMSVDKKVECVGRFLATTANQLCYRAATRTLLGHWGDVRVEMLVTDFGASGQWCTVALLVGRGGGDL